MDRIKGNVSAVSYRVDRVTATRVIFNDGGRIESLAGEVVANTSPIGGEADAAMPPGGWVKPGIAVGARWPLKYRTTVGSSWIDMQLQAHAVEETVVQVDGASIRALRIEYDGYNDRGPSTAQQVAARYKATAWYSPSLRRVVRFEARTRGGTGAFIYVVDELLELQAVR